MSTRRGISVAVVTAGICVAGFALMRSVDARGAELQNPVPAPPPPPPPPPSRDSVSPPSVVALPAGTGEIAGIVRSAGANPQPLRRALVTLRDTDRGAARQALTDDRGRYSLDHLPAGRYTVLVSKDTYVQGAHGAKRLGGPPLPVALADAQHLQNIDVSLTRGAVLTGRILGELGQPVAGVRVVAAERVTVGDQVSYRQSSPQGAVTDDIGVFRLWGVPPGTYVVSASFLGAGSDAARTTTADEVQWATSGASRVAGTTQFDNSRGPARGRPMRYAPTFYPGTVDVAAATPISVAAGEERAGLEIRIAAVPTVTISGTLTRRDALPVRGALLVPIKSVPQVPGLGVIEFPPRAVVSATGEFTISGIVPGTYMLSARAPSATGAPPASGRGGAAPSVLNDLWALADVVVTGEDLTNVALELAPGMSVSGRVMFEGDTPPPPASTNVVNVSLVVPITAGPSLGASPPTIAADGAVHFAGTPPGSFLVAASVRSAGNVGGVAGVPMWVVKSAEVGGRDVLDTPFDVRPGIDVSDLVVRFTDKVTQLSGTVVDQAGRPAPTYSVIVFTTDAGKWRQNSRWLRPPVRPATDGRFLVAGLPPGEYYMAVLTDFQPNDWYSPAFLQQVVPGAVRVTLGDGEKKIQDVKLAN